MRNILLSAVLLAGTFMAGAQETAEPNRLLVVSEGGSFKSYMTERVEAIEFRSVDGVAEAKVEIKGCTLNSVQTDITMSPACKSYMINCYPAVIAKQLKANPAGAFSYMASTGSPTYNENFVGGNLSGLDDMQPNTEYAIVTASYDEFGTECDVCLGIFTTPSLPLTGEPKVEFTQDDATHYTITGTFTPNKDVDHYAYLIGEKGELPQSFEQFAGMFGFSNMAQMVQMWGVNVPHDDVDEHTWNNLEPNKDYEIYVQMWDKKDVAAPMLIFDARTATMGGDGAAFVDIKITGYRMNDWDGVQKPSLFVNFTPNSQAGAYRVFCAYASEYDEKPQEYKDYVCSDPEMSVAHWFQYGPVSTDYQVNPDNTIVILAAAKNAKGEWGEVNEVRYTTPATVGMPKAAPGAVGVRKAPKAENAGDRVPANVKRGVRMEMAK